MTAPFVVDLCGYRLNGNPNTSDNNDRGSVEWGHALFARLAVPPGVSEVERVGSVMEERAASHLSGLRPDLVTARSRSATEFAQYRHLAVFQRFRRAYLGPSDDLADEVASLLMQPLGPEVERVLQRALQAGVQRRRDHELIIDLLETMPEESLLKVDLTIAAAAPSERLLVAISSKWSLRTDRAQDCISQGAKLVSLRRGHMPHYAVLTMEPRPAMLRLIAYGSGSVDCVYHLALPELRQAAADLEARRGSKPWKPRQDLERMVAQGRVRDYDDLAREVARLGPGAV
ncbi:NgoMIV family type II restriction endonuclease [Nostocoides sp. Soil756]|uniref:NgoMIV family type II restriction endonuclease n=1 Tax=Nostocoides sp. Soil756 TaxID=1736399 RepID=UPI000B16BCBA|nr:NgoMIV family type II restriction endonuclease [Tetrasphaera sp. Soil756]